MKYFRKLVGDKCYLSPISLDDTERYTEWVNDMELGQFMLFTPQVIDMEKERQTLIQLMQNNFVFAIVEKDTNKVIGNCGLHGLSEVHRHAELGVFIGEKTFWNQGIGSEACSLLLDFGFNVLNLHSISLKVFGYNKRAIKCYEKIGFKYAGTQREYIFMAGRYHDLRCYDILASEFESPYVKKIFEYSISDEAGRSKITIV